MTGTENRIGLPIGLGLGWSREGRTMRGAIARLNDSLRALEILSMLSMETSEGGGT